MKISVYLLFFLNTYICVLNGFGFHRIGMGIEYHNIKHWNLTDVAQNKGNIKWIEQPLDHFNQSESRKWKMRYYEDLQFSKKDGPIYVLICGKWSAAYCWMIINRYLVFQLANETNGAIIGSEHRYYGNSIPLDPSVTENLKYLSSRQALADFAHLIEALKAGPPFRNSKVVVVGGSYAGNLAAWMRLLYPHAVDAAVASSAPVLAKKDFSEYYEKVAVNYKKYGQKGCYEKISEIFNRYVKLLSSADGIEQLKRENNICEQSDMTRPENQQHFFDIRSHHFGVISEYSIDNIKKQCSFIMNKALLDEKEQRDCFDFDFSKYIAIIRNSSSYLAWMYQTCTEFGYFQTTANSNKHPFTKSVPLEYFVKICTALFGPTFNEKRIDEGVAFSNNQYGGMHPKVSKVVFVNGDADPWSELGILKDLSPDAPAKVIPDGFDQCDMYVLPGSSQEMIRAQSYIKKSVEKWLNL